MIPPVRLFAVTILLGILGLAARAAEPTPAWAVRLGAAVQQSVMSRSGPEGQGGAAPIEVTAAVTARRIGTTRHGRPLMLARIHVPGAASRRHIFVVTGQHGDEPAGPEAMLSLIEECAGWPAPAMVDALRGTDITIVPVANPDGFAAGARLMPGGTDLNRDWNARRTAEARAIWAAIREVRPDVLFDLHEDTPRDIPGAYVEMANPGGAYRLTQLVDAALKAGGHSIPVRSRSSWTSAGLLHAAFARSFRRPALLVETKYWGDPADGIEARADAHATAVKAVLLGFPAPAAPAGPTAPTPQFSTPTDPALRMIAAAKRGDVARLSKLVAARPDRIDGIDWAGATALHFAVDRDSAKAVRILLGAGANVNAAKSDGVTPLHVAAGMGRAALVPILLAAGADVTALDDNARTPLSIAKSRGFTKVVALLAPHTAPDAAAPAGNP